MTDSRRHRGQHPSDAEDFAPANQQRLNEAVIHLSWLLSRGYAAKSSLKLVGDRFYLTGRQRTAVQRACASEEDLILRSEKCRDASEVAGQTVWIDGFNLLTTIEAALSGGVLLLGQDEALRDMASMHGTYRKVEETIPSLVHIGKFLEQQRIAKAVWLLDQPVSNSAKLKGMIEEIAEEYKWNWIAQLVRDPDQLLRQRSEIVISADSLILNECEQWLNAATLIVENIEHSAVLMDLRG